MTSVGVNDEVGLAKNVKAKGRVEVSFVKVGLEVERLGPLAAKGG